MAKARPDLDVQKDIAEIDARLAEVERRHATEVHFVGGDLLRNSVDVDPRNFLVSTVEVTGAVDSDRGCLSRIRTRVSDAEKLLGNDTGGTE